MITWIKQLFCSHKKHNTIDKIFIGDSVIWICECPDCGKKWEEIA